ncbi:glycoside hydrolase [Wallemia mellicola]|uniref:glucan 1,3-beta-glucosidase n=2 Tax=Wallemia mellicola TaxID=1708541 RepID=A0A4T0NR51_9BASI|nr:glycoside hydrolase [Wallemia mellicola CBS 633.66]TIB78183.1 glycoside hydrolase [Wallemia mellicola]EIM19471.1 glycoside hydrolase [Wallemia mellicola CBS 633.66]TIB91756.1 glycoside hydrolase [Wallemia mellicola]TIB97109.1 glycoside hydrolase [Wallemia mellicola]TIB99860.1 glycoside hydrolase [Wallemia mellicola]|eukprot:XP_006960503.1 glycoside hydrolase [Wallemia mellicola CBS 633.66]
MKYLSGLTLAAVLAGLSACSAMPQPAKRAVGDLVRGVNLGGLLVLEPWITPQLFDETGDGRVIDEYTLGQYVDEATAESLISEHLRTFITADDLAQIKAAGLNAVRIPFPHWAAVPTDEPFYDFGRFDKLKEVVGWARDQGIRVWVDLHTARGSQNGFDNSGHKGEATWHTNQDNVNNALDAISALAEEFAKPEYAGAVEVIELMNEPASFLSPDIDGVVRQYYYDGFGRLADSGGQFATGLHDAFEDINSWDGFMTSPDFENIWMDVHRYQVFSPEELSRSDDERIAFACNYGPELEQHSLNHHWTVCGEFTTARTDCATYLNGRDGDLKRWDGSFPGSYYQGGCDYFYGNNGADYPEDYRQFLRKYYEAQIDAFERGSGWFFWTWHTTGPNAADWSYKRMLELGIYPQDPADRIYPNICG